QEAQYEDEFNAAIALLRTLITEENKTTVKTRSNFYSLYGACVKYHRRTGRTSFRHSDEIADAITDILVSVRSNEINNKPTQYGDYFEAVTRAASDKGRRVTREDILYSIIDNI